MSKKINRIIPKSMKPIGEKLAEIHCRDMGLDEGSDQYETEFKKYEYGFNDEAWGLSMTPSGLIGQNPRFDSSLFENNPATPKVQAHYFEIMSHVFGDKGYMSSIKNDDLRLKLERQLRGSVASLAHLLLETKYGLQIKGVNSSFAFKKEGEGGSPSENNKTVLAQYLRYFYSVQITKALEKIFFSKDVEIKDVISEVIGIDRDRQLYGVLNPPKVRARFVENLYTGKNKLISEGEEAANESKKAETLQNPRKGKNKTNVNEEVYYSHDAALYFDKIKLDDFIEKNKNDCAQIVPKKGYIGKVTVSIEDIKKADMNEPIVFGTMIKKGKPHNFLILGEAQTMKALKEGFPSIDCLVLDAMLTLKTLRPTKNTIGKITEMKNELIAAR
jgi:hypothetical protein